MTLNEIRAEKVKMEKAIERAIKVAQEEFEESTSCNVDSFQFEYLHHRPVGLPAQMWLKSVTANVNPW